MSKQSILARMGQKVGPEIYALTTTPDEMFYIAQYLRFRDGLKASLHKQAMDNAGYLASLAADYSARNPEAQAEFYRLLHSYVDMAALDLERGRW